MATKTYDATCSICGETYQVYKRRKALSACGQPACLAAEIVATDAARAAQAAAPRPARAPRPASIPDQSDWAMLCRMMTPRPVAHKR